MCLVGEMSVGEMSVGEVSIREVSVGEVFVSEVSGRGNVRQGRVHGGDCPSGNCQDTEKSALKLNSGAYEKYEYGYFGRWYIKLTLFNRFLIWNKISKKK